MVRRLPEWLRKGGSKKRATTQLGTKLRSSIPNSICEEAKCPNRSECFAKGVLTFMILGTTCTRNCGFCSVAHGQPLPHQESDITNAGSWNLHTNLEPNDRLLQTINGKTERGSCKIQYPKKIYCSYKLKHNKVLVSNGKSLVIKSDHINQYYYYPLKSTPFELLLDKNFILNHIKKSKLKVANEKYYYFTINKNNYEINVFFNNNNYKLMGWQTEDIYQNLIITFIYDLKINSNINKKLFTLPSKN